MGWNSITKGTNAVIDSSLEDEFVYFVHSYYAVPADNADVAATTPYGMEFASVISRDNIFAAQFHPEKSQQAGLHLLENFVNLI